MHGMANKSGQLIKNKKVIIVEDGPTLTHGSMIYGAGFLAAKKYKAVPVDPRKYAVGSIKKLYCKYKLENIVPAMGYGKKQINELKRTLDKAKADAVIAANPIDLSRLIKLKKPVVRVKYHIEEKGRLKLSKVVMAMLKKYRKKK